MGKNTVKASGCEKPLKQSGFFSDPEGVINANSTTGLKNKFLTARYFKGSRTVSNKIMRVGAL
jgi:hypothetical protein